MRAKILLGFALLATALVYWIGLHGPFLLDDGANLGVLQDWLAGNRSWQDVVFNNHSGMLGRPLSMASFLLTTALGGYAPFAFKIGNLVVHLLCGLLGWQVLRRAMAHDKHLAPNAELIASVLVALWLLHPLNVSTVLYAVQRMAQLGALFVLASLWVYLASRQALIDGSITRGLAGLFVLFPLLLVAGLLSKENAAVAPGLCLVLELAYFLPYARPKRTIAVFFTVFLVAPALFVAGSLAFNPSRLLGGYIGRDFTVGERLLSQPRALMDYIGQLVFPRNPQLGLFTDDFATSTGLSTPSSTLWALLAIVAISILAIALRKRAASVFAGWFFFLVAHAVESGFLPLELYFEHRNYLPAFGLLLAIAGLCELLTRNLQTNILTRRQLGWLAAGGFATVFAFGTHGRALTWQSEETIVSQALQTHPTSLRANLATVTLAARTRNFQPGYDALSRLQASSDPRHKLLGLVDEVTLKCIEGKPTNPGDLRRAVALAQPKLMGAETEAFELLDRVVAGKDCGLVSPHIIADSIDKIVGAASAQPDTYSPKWRLRLIAARLYARSGDWQAALTQAKLAWQPNANAAVGGNLAIVYAHNGNLADANRVYAETQARANPNNPDDVAGLANVRRFLDQSSADRQAIQRENIVPTD